MSSLKYIILLVLLCGASLAFAQGDWGGGENPWEQEPGEEIPIDGGALALLVGGAALGYKALKKRKEESAD